MRQFIGGFSPLTISAALSVAALLCVTGYRVEQLFVSHDADQGVIASATTSSGQNDTITDTTDDVNGFGPDTSGTNATSSNDIDRLAPNVVGQLATHYMVMQQEGTYTADAGAQVATAMAPSVKVDVPFTTYSITDIKSSPDTSYASMMKYRSNLQISLAPLLKNSIPEITIFGMYTDTKDTKYLTQLNGIAQNYRDAANATAKIVVPVDAAPYQLDILNAMQEFASTLNELTSHVDDPITTAALLRSYNQAEQDMLTSFNSLTTYYASKHS